MVNLLCCGCVVPVVKYIQQCWQRGDTDISLIRYFVTEVSNFNWKKHFIWNRIWYVTRWKQKPVRRWSVLNFLQMCPCTWKGLNLIKFPVAWDPKQLSRMKIGLNENIWKGEKEVSRKTKFVLILHEGWAVAVLENKNCNKKPGIWGDWHYFHLYERNFFCKNRPESKSYELWCGLPS